MDDVLAVSALLIPVCPLLVFLGTTLARPLPAVFGRNWIFPAGCAASFLATLVVVSIYFSSREASPVGLEIYRWISISGDYPLAVTVGLNVDPLSLLLLLAVTLTTTGFASQSTRTNAVRLKKELSSQNSDRPADVLISLTLFTTSMLLLSSNFLQLLVFWQLTVWSVGVCSGERGAALTLAEPVRRFVLVNLAGDILFVTGILLIWLHFEALDFADVLGNRTMIANVEQTNPAALSVISLCLLAGVLVRCAQFPLMSWINDDPSISTHAHSLLQSIAVMPAGIYVVIRCIPLFEASPVALQSMAFAGALTALLAAAVAITAWDLQRVLGHTTVSHFGLMFLGIGTGRREGIAAALFLLIVHVLVKGALSQLTETIERTAGGQTDLGRSPSGRLSGRMPSIGAVAGGASDAGRDRHDDQPQDDPAIPLTQLRRKLPAVHWTYLAGSLVLFSGFWGQNAVLASVWKAFESPASVQRSSNGHEGERSPSAAGIPLAQSPPATSLLGMAPRTQYALLLALATSALLFAAFAQFRAYFLVFYHEDRSSISDAQTGETRKPGSSLPAMLLVAAAIVVGPMAGTGWMSTRSLADWVIEADTNAAEVNLFAPGFGVLLVMLAIVWAWMLYVSPPARPGSSEIPPARRIARLLAPFERLCRNRFYLGDVSYFMLILPTRGLAQLCRFVDRHLVDGMFIDSSKTFLSEIERTSAPLRVGLIPFYVTSLLLATAVLAAVLSMLRGQV